MGTSNARDVATRFDNARRLGAAYEAAISSTPVPRKTNLIARMIATSLIVLGYGAFRLAVRPSSGWITLALCAAMVVAAIVTQIRRGRVAVRRELVMIASGWAGMRGSSLDGMACERSLTLRREDGDEFEVAADGALSVQEPGDIGIALIRNGWLVGFERLAV